ncbi:MAG TPA: zf-HC2 domain-containing protein [Gemmatimonadales bacterium]|nr:zf-HC2 domain-containing protein [Gemmatimonadales bacterium]
MSHVDDGTLHAYLDGELAPAEAQGVAAHVAQCPACRTRLDEERALIARADQLLGLAAPPDRQVPPFRAGDSKPPARLWWRVRLPIAWAATVVLALGVGMYLGSGSAPLAPPGVESARDLAEPDVSTLSARRETVAALRAKPAARQPDRPARPATPAGTVAAAEEKRADAAGAPAMAARPETVAAWRVREELAARALEQNRLAPAPAPSVSNVITREGYAQIGPPLTLDSARALLGTDPLAVPNLPVRGIHQARRIGYSTVVIVEQALDSTTTIDVISGRLSSLRLEAARPAERALLGRAGTPKDSVAPAGRKAKAVPAGGAVADPAAADLVGEVRGPLSADSLAALRRRLKPLHP